MAWSDLSTEECSEDEANEEDWDKMLDSLNGIEECLVKPNQNASKKQTKTHNNESRDTPKDYELTLPAKDSDNDIIFEKICKSDPTREMQQEINADNPFANKTQTVRPANTPIATINLDDIPEAEFTICELDDDEATAVPCHSRAPVTVKQKLVNHVDLTVNSISDDDSQPKKIFSEEGEVPTSETNDDETKRVTVERILKWRKVYLKRKQKKKKHKTKKRKKRSRSLSASPDHLAINEYNPAAAPTVLTNSVIVPAEKRSGNDSEKPRNYRSRSCSRDSDSSSLRWTDFYKQRMSRKRERTRERSGSRRRRGRSRYRSRSPRKRSSRRRTSSGNYSCRSKTRSNSREKRRKEKSSNEMREKLRKRNEEAVENLVKTNKEMHTSTSLATESLKIQVTESNRMVEHAERQQIMTRSMPPPGPVIPPSYPFSSNGYFTYTNVHVRQNVYCYNPYMPPW